MVQAPVLARSSGDASPYVAGIDGNASLLLPCCLFGQSMATMADGILDITRYRPGVFCKELKQDNTIRNLRQKRQQDMAMTGSSRHNTDHGRPLTLDVHASHAITQDRRYITAMAKLPALQHGGDVLQVPLALALRIPPMVLRSAWDVCEAKGRSRG
jgi:hypothetical protein